MQKKNTGADKDVIAVSVARMGQESLPLALPSGSTVRDALAKAGVSGSARTEYFVSGVRADMDDVLESGDVLSLVTPKQAGN